MRTIMTCLGFQTDRGHVYFFPHWRASIANQETVFPTISFLRSPSNSPFSNWMVHLSLARTGTIGELKRAVEESFHHFPEKGPSKISWEHVWGQFCLCHNGRKLLTDCNYIVLYGIQDGDQLQFTHHSPNSYNLARTPIKKENSDSDDELNSNGYKGRKKKGKENDVHRRDILNDNQEDDVESDNGIRSRREHRITHMLKGWFSSRKLTSSRIRIKASSSSRFSKKAWRKF